MKCSRRGDAARVVDCHHGCPETVGGSRRFEAVLVPDVTSARPLGTDAHEGRRMQMSRADGLYTAVQRPSARLICILLPSCASVPSGRALVTSGTRTASNRRLPPTVSGQPW